MFLYVVNISGNSLPVNGLESDGQANLLATTNSGALFRAELDVSFNRVFVDSASHPFLDQKAVITLLGLPGKKRRLLVEENDDGEFERCRGKQCKLRLFSGGTLVFKVDGFTTYSSEERTKKKDDHDDGDDDD